MTTALMIDIETLSTRPDAHVTQVGYCVADLSTGEYITTERARLMTDNQRGRHIGLDTLRWWAQQDRDVALGVFGSDSSVRHTAQELFQELQVLVYDHNIEEVWASPAMFDLPILTSLWEGEKPWLYYQERCLMTLRSCIDPAASLAPPPNPKHHDAAADARWQMDYLINLHRYASDSGIQATLPLWDDGE